MRQDFREGVRKNRPLIGAAATAPNAIKPITRILMFPPLSEPELKPALLDRRVRGAKGISGVRRIISSKVVLEKRRPARAAGTSSTPGMPGPRSARPHRPDRPSQRKCKIRLKWYNQRAVKPRRSLRDKHEGGPMHRRDFIRASTAGLAAATIPAAGRVRAAENIVSEGQ